MPASQSGFGSFFVDRALAPGGYQVPVLGCPPPGVQPQQLAAMAAGFPLAFSGLQGYNFIPYAHARPVTHMGNAYDLKAASPYHAAMLARAAPYYGAYRPGTAEDPARVAKVATRESTGALKAWLNEHLKNPYPTKGEKIMLAIITKMSLTQVSTWFANARRRLKKENRVSWASKSKSDDEEEEEEAEEEEGESDVDDKSLPDEEAAGRVGAEEKPEELVDVLETATERQSARDDDDEEESEKKKKKEKDCEGGQEMPKESKDNAVSQKPKIWSLAETATSEPVRKKEGDSAQMGRLWAEWASRNGLFVPTVYPAPEVL